MSAVVVGTGRPIRILSQQKKKVYGTLHNSLRKRTHHLVYLFFFVVQGTKSSIKSIIRRPFSPGIN